jgi:O-antigen/teichoic acid export membrane protein
MRKHLTNAAYGVLDYVSYPLGMLLVAPIVLHKLGAAEYGLWMIATALISAGGIIASGFSDAGIQRVAYLRGTGDSGLIPHTVRSMLGINLVLGFALAVAAWIAAPYAAPHIAVSRQTPSIECLISLRIASVLIFLRSIETVGVSTQRAFEQYRGTVQISTAVRLLTLGAAAAFAWLGQGTINILVATSVVMALGTYMQFRQIRKHIGPVLLWPVFQPGETQVLLGLGIFVWLQAVGAVVFGQFDRILLGVSLGALAVAPYSLCVQFAHPIFGLSASGLNFLFPYLSGRASTISSADLKRTLLKVFACNLLLVACGAVARCFYLVTRAHPPLGRPGAVAQRRVKDSGAYRAGFGPDGAQRNWNLCHAGAWPFPDSRLHQPGVQNGDVAADDRAAAPHGTARVGTVPALLRLGSAAGLSAAAWAAQHS